MGEIETPAPNPPGRRDFGLAEPRWVDWPAVSIFYRLSIVDETPVHSRACCCYAFAQQMAISTKTRQAAQTVWPSVPFLTGWKWACF